MSKENKYIQDAERRLDDMFNADFAINDSPSLDWARIKFALKENAELRAENERLRAVAAKLIEADWCIGYEVTEQVAVILDEARTMAFEALNVEQGD